MIGGLYDSTPDHRPLLGPAPGLRGLHLAVGFSGHGFMIAPASGEMVAAGNLWSGDGSFDGGLSLERFSTSTVREGLVI